MKKIIALLICLAMVLSMIGCAGEKSPEKPTDTNPPVSGETNGNTEVKEDEYKDTLIFSPNTDAQSLDPQVQNDTTSEQIVKMLYNTLLKFDDKANMVGDLAEKWTVSEDQKTWTIKLKEGVKFHNGKEMTSEDVKATYERAMSAEAGGLRTTEIIKMFEKVETVDKYTVSITTDEPYGPMEALMCNMSLGIMDSEYIVKYGLDLGKKQEAENGTGPYKLVSWKVDEELVIEKFDDYFGEESFLKTIIYQPIPEAASRVIALETGEVDVISGIPAEELGRLEKDKKLTVVKAPTVGQRLFRFGCNDPIISNTKVRQAITYAIDRQVIIDSLFNGSGYPSTSALSKVTFGYADMGVIKQDKEKAKKLLAEAGYPDGFETKIVTTERYLKGVQLAEILSSQLAEVGIKAKIDVWEWSALGATWDGITKEEFDEPIFIMGAGPSMRDADGGLRGLYTTSETGLNDRNYGFYSNAEVDKMISEGMKETNPEKRKGYYKRAIEILYLEDPAGIWLFDMYGMAAMSDKVEGVTVSPISTITFEKAKIKK